MSRTITVSDDVYSHLHEISREHGISFDVILKELITDLSRNWKISKH